MVAPTAEKSASAAMLAIAGSYSSIRYTQLDAQAWAREVPAWISPELAVLAVEELYTTPQQTIDGRPPALTAHALAEMCRTVQAKLPNYHGEDDTVSRAKSTAGRYAASYNAIVDKVFAANPELLEGQGYFHGLSIARGVLNSENNIYRQKYTA